MNILCVKCKVNKPSKEFYSRPKRNYKFQSYCRSCHNKYCMIRWKARKIKAIEYKGGKCEDCEKEFPPYIYDFHHLDPKIKEMTWTKMRLRSWKNIQKELDKCVLLCSNCHRTREYGGSAET